MEYLPITFYAERITQKLIFNINISASLNKGGGAPSGVTEGFTTIIKLCCNNIIQTSMQIPSVNAKH